MSLQALVDSKTSTASLHPPTKRLLSTPPRTPEGDTPYVAIGHLVRDLTGLLVHTIPDICCGQGHKQRWNNLLPTWTLLFGWKRLQSRLVPTVILGIYYGSLEERRFTLPHTVASLSSFEISTSQTLAYFTYGRRSAEIGNRTSFEHSDLFTPAFVSAIFCSVILVDAFYH